MGNASESNLHVDDTFSVKHTIFDASDQPGLDANTADVENLIPTAVVKPKYQKLSFDERQLPVCGSADENSSKNSTDAPSTTIIRTPRKVQKHLPKTQKSFAKQTRKLLSGSVEKCIDTSNDEATSSLIHSKKESECSLSRNSIAIVQPIKKIVAANVSANMSDEKYQKATDSSKNSININRKHKQKMRNSSKKITTNELVSDMNESGNNNCNAMRNVVNVVRESEMKVPTSKKDLKDNAGKEIFPFSLVLI